MAAWSPQMSQAAIGPNNAMSNTASKMTTAIAAMIPVTIFTLNSKPSMQQSDKAQRQLRFPTTSRKSFDFFHDEMELVSRHALAKDFSSFVNERGVRQLGTVSIWRFRLPHDAWITSGQVALQLGEAAHESDVMMVAIFMNLIDGVSGHVANATKL